MMLMQCERAQDHFSDYLEQTLDRPLTVTLEAHLNGCPACREEVAALRSLCLDLNSMPEVEPPWDGAWQVMAQVRNARAEQYEAQRRRAPSFLQWLRSLNPASAVAGAGLATLVVGGTLLFPGVGDHVRNAFIWLRPSAPLVAARPAETLGVTVSNGPLTVDGRQVDLDIRAPMELPDGVLEVSGAGMSVSDAIHRSRPVRVMLPATSTVETLRVTVSSPSTGKQYRSLVVVPLGESREQPVTLMFESEPLDEALRRLAPSLGRPVVVAGLEDERVHLGADGAMPRRCLDELAAQAHAQVREENGSYLLVAAP
jgi:anti-sigma factor RsiW